MNNYLIYCIDFTTTHYGNGIALVISDNCDTAIDILKTHGRLNGEPDEYRLLKQEVVGVSTITECTLVSEHYTGVTVIVGPKGKDGSEVPYSELQDLPSINGTTIVGNMLASQFNITTSQIINNSGYVVDNNYNHTDNNFTDILKNKLVNIPIPVQSDWNVTDISALDYIKNKPNIPAAQVQVDWNATTGITSILNKPILANVAISGNYNDLINIPDISKYRTIEEQNIIDNNFQSDINNINSALNDKQRKLIAGSNIILNEESTGVRITAISGAEGTFDHRDLTNKDAANQHPISAITNLQTTLNNKQNIISDINTIRNNAELGATALQDAPSDNKQYARKNGTWIEVDKGDNTTDHRELEYKDAANQHPISAITGLQDALDGKQAVGNYATTQELDTLADIVDSKYVRPSSGIPESDLSNGVQGKLNFKEIFLCTYNTTTFQEVSNALDAGKLPVCIYLDRYHVYSGLSNGYHTFQCFITLNNIATYYRLYLKNSWGNANITVAQDSQCEKVDNKVTSWSTTPNDTHYPSEKLVKNNLDSKINEPSTEGTNGQVLTTDGNGGRSWTSVQGGESVRGIIDFPTFTNISPVYIGQSSFSPTAPHITNKYVYKLSSNRTGGTNTLTFAQGSTAISEFEDYVVYIEMITSSGFIIQFPNGWNKLGEISTASGNNNSYIIHFYPSCQLVKIEAYGPIN